MIAIFVVAPVVWGRLFGGQTTLSSSAVHSQRELGGGERENVQFTFEGPSCFFRTKVDDERSNRNIDRLNFRLP